MIHSGTRMHDLNRKTAADESWNRWEELRSAIHNPIGRFSCTNECRLPSTFANDKNKKNPGLLLNVKNLKLMEQNQMNLIRNEMFRDRNLKQYLRAYDKVVARKQLDSNETCSIASSMNFTIVNGSGNGNGNEHNGTKRSFCRKHQLTVLIMSMSSFFSVAIFLAVYLLEGQCFFSGMEIC